MKMADREYCFPDSSKRCLPLDLQHPADMTRSGLDTALEKGMKSIREGRTHTLDEVDAELKKNFGI